MNLEYLGSVGSSADTPVGIVRTGEVIAVDDKLGARLLATGNFKKTDKPETHPKAPSPFAASPVVAAAAAQAATSGSAQPLPAIPQ